MTVKGAVKQELKKPVGHIALVSADESVCTSCGTCALVCAAVHGDAAGPSLAAIWLDRRPILCEYIVLTCEQCDVPECYYACKAGAFYIDEKTGARAIDAEKCVGCRRCIEACTFAPPRIHWEAERKVAVKCDLCSGRDRGPACIEFCPQKALKLVE